MSGLFFLDVSMKAEQREAFLVDLVGRIDLSADEAAQILLDCLRIPLGDGIRVEVLSGVEEFVRVQAPHRVSRFVDFVRLFPDHVGMGVRYMPVGDFHLILMQAARLIYPHLPLCEAMLEHTKQGCYLFFENPLFSIVTRAVSNDLGVCLENLVQGAAAHLFNYGHRELERVSARNYRLIFSGDHPVVYRERIPPFLHSLIRRFQRRGEVVFEWLDEQEFGMTLRWD